MPAFVKMLKDQSGASAAEYAMILAIIGSALAIASVALGKSIGGSMNRASGCIDSKTSASCS
jgi:pilus assembly protein Flp/PilA